MSSESMEHPVDGGMERVPPAEPASALFVFSGGLAVSPDDEDNPDNHVVLHHESGTKVSFVVANVGTAPGAATVGIQVDGVFVTEWTSWEVQPGADATPPEVKGIGRYPEGSHTFLAYVNPSAGSADNVTNTVDIA